MIDTILFIPIIASFFIALFLMPSWIKKAKQIGLMWDDVNKIKSPKVAGSGGLIVILSSLIGMLLFIAYRVFILNNNDHLIEIFSIIVAILVLAVIGLVDDLFGWQHGGLSRRSRIVLCFLAAIPLMAINAGRSIIDLPFLGTVDLGILYPLILIPLGIIGAATTFNFLAGFNGLEAGNGIITLSGLGIVAFLTGSSWLTIVAFCMVASLCAFLIFNINPAKVFPGDVITYPIGGLMAILAILGNFEKIALFFFIPVVIEVILKSRGRLVKSSFGLPQKDGTLKQRHDGIYGLTHLSIYVLNRLNIRSTETNVTLSIWLFNLIIVLVGLALFIL